MKFLAARYLNRDFWEKIQTRSYNRTGHLIQLTYNSISFEEFGALYGEEFVVPYSSRSRSLALKSSTSLSENIILWVKTLPYFTQMMIFSPNTKNKKKVSFDDFYMTTGEKENERKKDPQIPRLNVYFWIRHPIWKFPI